MINVPAVMRYECSYEMGLKKPCLVFRLSSTQMATLGNLKLSCNGALSSLVQGKNTTGHFLHILGTCQASEKYDLWRDFPPLVTSFPGPEVMYKG